MNLHKKPVSKKPAVVTVTLTGVVGILMASAFFAAGTPLAFEAETGTLAGCAATSANTGASGGSAVKFADCSSTGDTSTPLNLAADGASIPDTNYAIPAGAIFMDDAGNDANAGTQSAPVKTLNRAVALVPSPGTIVVRAGVYRDWYYSSPDTMGAVIGKGVTFQAYPHEQAWFDGTDIVSSGWTANTDGTWSVPWITPSFCMNQYYSVPIGSQSVSPNTGPCYHFDMSRDPANLLAGDPQMAFINGTYIHQVATRAEAANNPNNFFYDHAAKVVYIGTSPSGKTVELSKRPQAIILGGANTSIAIKGLGFRRYATTEFEGLPSAAIYIGGSTPAGGSAIVENNTFTAMAGGTLTMRPRGGIVRHNAMVLNGYTAMGSNGHSQNDGLTDGLLMEGNLFSGNNTERFGTGCTVSCGHAAVKIAHMVGFTARDNIFEKTIGKGAGIWCDNDCTGGIMVRNIVRYNGGAGIFYEVSSGGIIASNLIYNNGMDGIQLCAADTKVYNNTIVNNTLTNIWVYDDNRNTDNSDPGSIGPDTRNVNIFNNIMYGGSVTTLKVSEGDPAYTLNTGPNEFVVGFDYNSYYRAEGSGRSMINWVDRTLTGNYKSLTELQAQHPNFETHGQNIYAPATDPFFTNVAANDYRLKSGSVAISSGTAIPADVAAAIGISTASGQDRGALKWPGKP